MRWYGRTTLTHRTTKIPSRLLLNQEPLNQLPVNHAPLDQDLLGQDLLDHNLLDLSQDPLDLVSRDQLLLSQHELSQHQLNPAEPDQQQWAIPSMKYWTMKKLWPNWPKTPPRALGIDGAIRQNRIELDAREDIISMEFLKFGDLGKWIGKMTGQNNMDPNSMFSERVAWIVFECLWRGCVALAYPTGFYQGKDPMTTQIPQVNEAPETSSVGGGDPLVHFDLDPQNIFVGDFAADHGLWPVTKIGDLGLSLQPLSQVFEDDIDEE
ncbi:hypothetical protein FJTKL_01795 [Diaporthe vaccinii]|uniref:Protein kinase domain-containing protein n=1 Tax=Diaporthe vaccinii TaxID=105482 RepID=A0ABR4F4A3_9PEZI